MITYEDKFNGLLKELNKNEIEQTSYWEDCIPKEIYKKYFDKYTLVTTGIDIDTHRWYETSTTVIKIYGKFLGIDHIAQVFSESMGFGDCGVNINFFEMEEFTTVSYRKKEKNVK